MLTGVAELREPDHRRWRSQRPRRAVSAEATALRRLERDIHDGPQQRLVRLAIDLGRAQQQFDADPEAARRTVDEALAQTRETLDELRALSRGIAPPILVDRGLPSALAALAGRGRDPGRPVIEPVLGTPERAAGPGGGERRLLRGRRGADQRRQAQPGHRAAGSRSAARAGALRVVIADDGEGGAHIAKGHGLAGLADRVHAAGGG